MVDGFQKLGGNSCFHHQGTIHPRRESVHCLQELVLNRQRVNKLLELVVPKHVSGAAGNCNLQTCGGVSDASSSE
jgi:hypothetical protein